MREKEMRNQLLEELNKRKIPWDLGRDETISIHTDGDAKTGLILAVERVKSDYFDHPNGKMYSANYYEHDAEGNHGAAIKTRMSTDLEDVVAWALALS